MSGVSDLEFGQGVGSPCWSDTDCDRDTYCAPGIHRCEYQQEIGAECLEPNECKGDYCADGVCCNTECVGACESCAVEGSVGTCTPHPADTDPDDECPGTATCDGQSACVGASLWAHSWGDEWDEYAPQARYDSEGNLVLAGRFEGEIDLGGNLLASLGYADFFVAKFDPAGELVWAQRFGSDYDQDLGGMAIDAEDRIVLGGRFSHTFQIGSTTLSTTGDETDGFVAQLSPDGTPLWAIQIRGETAGWQAIRDVAVDADGNIAVAGMFSGDITLAGVTYPYLESYDDMFLAVLDAQGTMRWGKTFTVDGDYMDARSVAFDGSGNVLFGGDSARAVDLGQGPMTPQNRDIFLAKYNSEGTVVWVKEFGENGDQVLADMAVDSGGNVVLTGWFDGGVTFGGSQLTSEGARDIFVAKVGPAGGHQWSRRFGGAYDQEGRGVAVGLEDQVALTGMFVLETSFGEEEDDLHRCAGASDAYLAKLDAAGELVWSVPVGGVLDDAGAATAFDPAGNVAMTGTFRDTLELGGTTFESVGGADAFVAVFGP